jgi:hypothetical protein
MFDFDDLVDRLFRQFVRNPLMNISTQQRLRGINPLASREPKAQQSCGELNPLGSKELVFAFAV